MVSSVNSTPGHVAADLAPRLGTGAAAGPSLPAERQATPAQVQHAVQEARTEAAVKPLGPAPVPLVSNPIVPPLTSLALYKDSESGMQVSVVRDRVTGELVEQVPTERARRVAAIMRQQDQLAQELHSAETTARVNIET